MKTGLAVTLSSVLLPLLPAMLLYVSAAVEPGKTNAVCDRSSSGVPSTQMEAALDELRRRFPNQIVIGFEEFASEQRPACEPRINLGPPGTTLNQALKRVWQVDAKYRVEIMNG